MTRDMAETLLENFERFAEDEVVTIEVNPAGVWFVEAAVNNARFIGQADYSPAQLARLRRLHH
jgi:hypothetical protein